MRQHSDQLARLGELSDYKVAEGDPDPRGWAVVTSDGKRIGRVDDLIVDPAAERAEYLDVELERGERHVLIPTEAVRLGPNEQERQQVAVGASPEYLLGVTPYQGLPLTPAQHAEYRACPPPSGAPFEPVETRISRGDKRHG